MFKSLAIRTVRQRLIMLSIYSIDFECHGDRNFGDDEAIVGGIAKYKGMPVTVIGHQRGKDTKKISGAILACHIRKVIGKLFDL